MSYGSRPRLRLLLWHPAALAVLWPREALAAGGCSSARPPIWPRRFTALQRLVPVSDPDCSGGRCANVTTYYDWGMQANLLVIRPDGGGVNDTLWDLELGNHHYLFHPALRQCKFSELSIGVLRPDWLDGAAYLGESVVRGKRVQGWTKADFIDYYASAEDCTPVRWFFHKMNASFDTLTYSEGAAVPDASFFKAPAYCPNRSVSETEHPARTGGGLRMRLCADEACSLGCKLYSLPLGTCYSPRQLFPGDPQLGHSDVEDMVNSTHLSRSFFSSRDGTCALRTDGFSVPLGACVGQYGAPRPWGMPELVADISQSPDSSAILV